MLKFKEMFDNEDTYDDNIEQIQYSQKITNQDQNYQYNLQPTNYNNYNKLYTGNNTSNFNYTTTYNNTNNNYSNTNNTTYRSYK
jgi:hypothetical protein